MMHPLFLLYLIDMFSEKIVNVCEKVSISGRTTAVVRSHISCCAHIHHVLCSRSSAVVRSSVYTETKLPNPLEKVGWGIVFRAHVQGVKKVWNSVICAICMSFFWFFFCLHIFFLTFAIVKYISNASTHSKYK